MLIKLISITILTLPIFAYAGSENNSRQITNLTHKNYSTLPAQASDNLRCTAFYPPGTFRLHIQRIIYLGGDRYIYYVVGDEATPSATCIRIPKADVENNDIATRAFRFGLDVSVLLTVVSSDPVVVYSIAYEQ